MTQATAIIPKNGNSTLAAFGTRDDIRELRERLKLMVPGGSKLQDSELAALAQGSIAHGLDPLNGEIWFIPGRGLMIGVKGLRKKAREQVKGNFWIDFREITNIEERKRWGIPDLALAFEARLFDTENILTYTSMAEKMLKAGIPWSAVENMIGTKPFTSGIGVLKAGENTKMERVQCAMKRAEADALKRRFDVPFGMAVEVDSEGNDGQEWVDGVYADEEHITDKSDYSPTPESIAKTQADLEAKRARDKAAMFPED